MSEPDAPHEAMIGFEVRSPPTLVELRAIVDAAGGPRTVDGEPLAWSVLEKDLAEKLDGDRLFLVVAATSGRPHPSFSLDLAPPHAYTDVGGGVDERVHEPTLSQTPLPLATLATGAWNSDVPADIVREAFLRVAYAVREILRSPFAFGGARALFEAPGDARERAWPIAFYAGERARAAAALELPGVTSTRTPDGGAWLRVADPLAWDPPTADRTRAVAKRLGLR